MSTTINKEEIQKFSKLADEWWDVNGKFKPLHMFNPVRIEYITENIKKQFNIKKQIQILGIKRFVKHIIPRVILNNFAKQYHLYLLPHIQNQKNMFVNQYY